MTFKGRRACLYSDTKEIIRHFNVNADIVNAQITGNSSKDVVIALTMKNGKTILYKSDGTIIRR